MSAPKPQRASKLQRLGLWMVTLAVSLVTGVGLGLTMSRVDIPLPGLAGFLALWLLVYYLGIGLHETGHFLVARAVGLAPHMLIIGPIRLTWDEDKVTAQFERRFPMGGLVIVRPQSGQMLPRQMALMTAGGPGASVAVALVCLAIAFAWPEQWITEGLPGYVPAFFLLLGFMSALLAVLSLFPSRLGGLVTDGSRLIRLWRGGPEAERDAVIWSVLATMYGPTRLSAVPAELIESATRLADGSLEECQAHALAYSFALDRGDVAVAGAHLERAVALISTMPKMVHPALWLEVCYFAARHGQDVEQARDAFAKSLGGLGIQPWSRLRAESALALAEGEHAKASALAREGLAMLARKPGTGANLLEAACLDDLVQQAGSQQKQGSPPGGGVL